jgi:hypothetical protein
VRFPKWFRRRRYLHFDLPVTLEHATLVVTDEDAVATHAFYPFVRSVITSVKLKKNRITKQVERKHKDREIAYAAHLDSHIYANYAQKIGDRYEERINALSLDSCVLAFRSLGKSNIEFALSAFQEIASRESCDVVALDIKGFFDNLDHGLMKKSWAAVLDFEKLPRDHFNLYRSLTRWCRVDKAELYAKLGISLHNPQNGDRRRLCEPDVFREKVRGGHLLTRNDTNKGIPQGSPMSALLSNIYMLDFDCAMNAFAGSIGAKYMRYCDDMILIGTSGTGADIKRYAHEQIAKVKLEIQDDKTEERSFATVNGRLVANGPLQYLGFVFDGKNLRIRDGSMLRYLDRMRRGTAVARNSRRKFNDARLSQGRAPKKLHLKKLYRQILLPRKAEFCKLW